MSLPFSKNLFAVTTAVEIIIVSMRRIFFLKIQSRQENRIAPLNLQKILDGDEKCLEILRKQLYERGFSIIEYPEYMVKLIETASKEMKSFFNNNELNEKQRCKLNNNVTGYNYTEKREGFRILTGNLLTNNFQFDNNDENKSNIVFPSSIQQSLMILSQTLDSISLEFVIKNSKYLFNKNYDEINELDILPLLKEYEENKNGDNNNNNNNNNNNKYIRYKSKQGYGMLDFVNYFKKMLW